MTDDVTAPADEQPEQPEHPGPEPEPDPEPPARPTSAAVMAEGVDLTALMLLEVDAATSVTDRAHAVDRASLAISHLHAVAAVEQATALHRIAAALEARPA